jgi:hypothetical protein
MLYTCLTFVKRENILNLQKSDIMPEVLVKTGIKTELTKDHVPRISGVDPDT